MVAGWAYAAMGLAYMLNGLNASRVSAMRFQLEYVFLGRAGLPIWAWGAIFLVVGVASVISSRWPPASETWGYTAMTGLSTLWGLCYLAGIPGGAPLSNITSFIVWTLIGFLWWAISGLVSPEAQKQRILVLTYDEKGMSVDAQSYDLSRAHGISQPQE
jgi:hypothetical protein